MPTLSYCKFVNNCSPNLLLFKVDRYEKLYFDPFLLAVRFGPALHSCLFILHNALPCFLPTLCSTFALPLLICPSAMTCPALYYSTLCPVRSCPANSPISGRSDRKVLRLIYIYIVLYRHDSKMTKIGHFATRFLTKPKEMGTIWTSSFEDKSLNFIVGYF